MFQVMDRSDSSPEHVVHSSFFKHHQHRGHGNWPTHVPLCLLAEEQASVPIPVRSLGSDSCELSPKCASTTIGSLGSHTTSGLCSPIDPLSAGSDLQPETEQHGTFPTIAPASGNTKIWDATPGPSFQELKRKQEMEETKILRSSNSSSAGQPRSSQSSLEEQMRQGLELKKLRAMTDVGEKTQ